MLKLSSAAGTIISLSLVLAGCGSDQWNRDGRDAALSVLTPRAPAPAEVVRSSKVFFSGRSSAASGGRVTVTAIDGQNRTHTCATTIRSDQTWSCTQQLADGGYTWTAQIATPDFSSAGIDFVVRTRGLAAPTIDPTPSPTRDSSPILTGTSSVVSEDEDNDEDDIVSLFVSENGKVICTIRSVTYDQWACPLSTKLADGAHLLTAVIKKDGSTSAMSNPDRFVVKTSIGAPTMDQVPTPSNVTQPVLSGHGEPGAVLSVTDAGTLLCAATVSAGGSWTCTPATLKDGTHTASATQQPAPLRTGTFDGAAARSALSGAVLDGERQVCSGAVDPTGGWSCHPQDAASLPDGTYLLVARLTDGKGHFSGVSMARVLVVDRTPPKAPVLDQPASPTRKHLPVLGGTAEDASAVTVIDADSAATLCETSANGEGAFNCKPDRGLTAGSHQFSATATDAAGNVSLPAAPVGVTISDVVPPPPTIDSPADGSEVENSRPVLTGHTAAGTTVQVTLDGALYEAQVAPDGTWTLLPSAELSFGPHQVSAAAIDADQNVSDPAQSAFKTVESGVARGGCSSGGATWPLVAVAAFLAVMPRRRARALAVLSVVALPLAGRAQTTSMDVSLFRPAAGGDGFAAVEGARPPLPGEQRFEVRTWTDYAVHPLTFRSQLGSDDVLVRSRTGGWLALQAHLLGPLSVSAQLPVTYSQQGDLSNLPPSSRGPSSLLGGFGDLRLTPRLALLRQEWAGIDLATQVSLEFPTARARTLTDDGRVRAEGLLAIGRRLVESGRGDLDLLGNAFLRLRPPHELLDVKTGNEAGLRAGVGYLPPRSRAWLPRRVYAEMEARTFLRAGFAAGTSPAEWRVGATVCPVRGVAVDLAGGGALTDGVGAPRARFLFGVGWSPSACNENVASLRPFVRPAPLPVQVFSEALSCPPVPSDPKVVQAAYVPEPPPDRDGDGVPDSDDSCPDQPGPVANYGCPIGARQMVTVSATRVEILEQVRFDTNRATIKPQSHKLLDQVAGVLLSHPDLLLVQVEGHTDDRGSALRNIVLAQSRAEAVAAYLEAKGVPAERLRAVGFGQGRPIATNASTAGRATNRRVAFTVLQTRSRVIEAGRPPDS